MRKKASLFLFPKKKKDLHQIRTEIHISNFCRKSNISLAILEKKRDEKGKKIKQRSPYFQKDLVPILLDVKVNQSLSASLFILMYWMRALYSSCEKIEQREDDEEMKRKREKVVFVFADLKKIGILSDLKSRHPLVTITGPSSGG